MALRVGFIGLGNIGRPMAMNLLGAGFPLTVHDVRPDALQGLDAEGASVAGSASQVAAQSDVICIAVVDDVQLEVVVSGDAGVLAGCAPGTILMIHSTVSPTVCRRIADLASVRQVGVVDAPVSGAAAGAEAATLNLFVGGDARHVESCRPLLDVLGARVFHLGALGMGQAAKICNNLMFTVNLRAALEALELARAVGIDETQMRAIAAVSTGRSWPLEHLDEMRELMDHPLQSVSASELGEKDLSLALDMGRAAGVELPITACVRTAGSAHRR